MLFEDEFDFLRPNLLVVIFDCVTDLEIQSPTKEIDPGFTLRIEHLTTQERSRRPKTKTGEFVVKNSRPNNFLIWMGLFVTGLVSTSELPAQGFLPGSYSTVADGSLLQTGGGDARLLETDGTRRITLDQVKQTADPIAGPLGHLGQLSIQAAKQHRKSVEADYFPKFGATAFNLHFTDFLGQFLTVRRPIAGTLVTVPVAIFNQNQTVAALTFTQPITPLFMVYQAVKIARADEHIAIAKAANPVAKSQREKELEEAYFNLLITQRRLATAELKLKRNEGREMYAGTRIELASTSTQEDVSEAKAEFGKLNSKVKELMASLDMAMGWPPDTQLELAMPDPLVEEISLQDVSDKSAAGNVEVVEAQETVVKARAAETISKLAYVPTVAAVSGYLFQNAIPAVPSNFAYGGAIASYTLFDFGKREHDIKEAHAKREMAEVALQLTKTNVAANVTKAYLELQHSRDISQIAQKMGSSVGTLLTVNASAENLDLKAARAEVEIQMLESDLAHRRAYANLKELMGSKQ